jgi:hypothetical protein
MAEFWIGSIFTPWAVVGGFGLTLLGMLGWGWQSSRQIEVERVDTDLQIIDTV